MDGMHSERYIKKAVVRASEVAEENCYFIFIDVLEWNYL